MLKLHDPIYLTLPVEVMLCGTDEIQILLLANPDEGRELTELLMIRFELIKLVNTGIYGKSIERWNNIPTADQKQLVEFHVFLIAEYERMLREGQKTTNLQEGYGTLEGDDGESMVEAITQYGEIATSAVSKMSDMESELPQINLSV